MPFTLPDLPYSNDALSPQMSAETLQFHYGKHHKAYVDKLNHLTKGTKFAEMKLEDVIRQSDGAIFNNAAQVWNHTFFWQCLSPKKNQLPTGELLSAMNKSFGDLDQFKTKFSEAALGQFGSGWAWLTAQKNGLLEITTTSNAETPIQTSSIPLLTCDVWEHAYYLDHRNQRDAYLKTYWEIVNWDFVQSNFKNV